MLEPIINEEFYALIAPDGSIQTMTLAPDLTHCLAVVALLRSAKLVQSERELKTKEFKYQKVKVTITQ